MHPVLYRRTAAVIKMASKVGPLFVVVSFAVALQPLGQYGASSCPMVASSGFWGSLGHAALGNAICIAPACLHGYQNCL
jgi:hypothetical protein